MGKKIHPDPELEAEWAELDRLTRKRVAGALERERAYEARDERRRTRLRRLSFGLLGR
jgi:hypothetical protein